MTENFYYLGAYTAAKAAGFTADDALAVAQAARFAERYTADGPKEHEGSPAEKAESPGMMSALHYLPGDPELALKQMDPKGLSSPELVNTVSLMSLPGGRLSRYAAQWAREYWQDGGEPRKIRQFTGIVLHALADAYLHQGFAGAGSAAVNDAAGILTAMPLPPGDRKRLLTQYLSQPTGDLFQMEPYVPEEPPAPSPGCGQLGALPGIPSQIFAYQSPWRASPTVVCVNPFRFAGAYLVMKDALLYIYGETPDFAAFSGSSPDLLELALFFSGVSSDSGLPEAWHRQFRWCGPVPRDYWEPVWETDGIYIDSFETQLLAFRDLVWEQSPELRYSVELSKSQKTGGLS